MAPQVMKDRRRRVAFTFHATRYRQADLLRFPGKLVVAEWNADTTIYRYATDSMLGQKDSGAKRYANISTPTERHRVGIFE
jgi:hypothetical protein